MKVRIKFSKYGCMKYVGHLDIMRYFQKAIRRSNIQIKYSEGFNPHQIMSFAAPLGVGITSEGEYMDIEIKEEVLSSEGVQKLQDAMVDNMEIVQFRYLADSAKNAMSSVTAASYSLMLKHPEICSMDLEDLQKQKTLFFDQAEQIQIIKKTKKGERELDLKPLIFQFDIRQMKEAEKRIFSDVTDTNIVFDLMVSTGSVDNIKPELVLQEYFKSFNIDVSDHGFFIHRKDMFTTIDEKFVSLGDVGHDR